MISVIAGNALDILTYALLMPLHNPRQMASTKTYFFQLCRLTLPNGL